MKKILLGFTLLVYLALAPAVASAVAVATPAMDGTYVFVSGFSLPDMGVDMTGYEIFIGDSYLGITANGFALPTSDDIPNVGDTVGDSLYTFTRTSASAVEFFGTLEGFTGVAYLNFFNPDSTGSFLGLFVNLAGTFDGVNYFSAMATFEKTHTPIPGAFLLLGTGLAGLVVLRKRSQA